MTTRPRTIFTGVYKEPSRAKNPGGLFEFENFLEVCQDQGMAKFIDNVDTCPKCCCYYTVSVVQTAVTANWDGYGNSYTPPTTQFIKSCACDTANTDNHYKPSTNAKETKVAKQFDTTEAKNIALNTIVSKVEAVERALYNRAHTLAKAETEHNMLVAVASNSLNNVLAEAYQSGIEEEDLENFLPDHAEELSERLNDVANVMSLANVLDGV